MILRRATAKDDTHELTVGLLREIFTQYTHDDLTTFIVTGAIPPELVQLAVKYIDKHPALFSLSDVQFRAAAMEASAEVGMVLDTPAGRQWTEIIARRIATAVPMGWLKNLFGRSA